MLKKSLLCALFLPGIIVAQMIAQVDSADISFEIVKLSPDRWQDYKNFRLESVRETDRPGVESEAEINAKSDDEWKKFLTKANEEKEIVVLFAQDKGKIIGIAGAELGQRDHFKHRAFLFNIHVLPEYRKHEIGKQLVQELLERLKEKGILVVLGIMQSEHGKNLYESYGFKLMGVCPKNMFANGRYYDGYYMIKVFE